MDLSGLMGLRRKSFALLFFGLLAFPATALAASASANAVRQEIHIAADDNYPPYLFRDDSGHIQGYLLDYWRLWSAHTGVKVRLTATNWAHAQTLLNSGQVDALDTIFRTPARERIYDYSPPYAKLPVAIYHHVSISGISNVETLKGFNVGVQRGDACIDILRSKGISSFVVYSNYPALITAASKQEVKVFCLDEIPANFYFYRMGVRGSIHKGFDLYTGEFHRAVRKGDTATLDLIERGMASISSAEEAALHDKWFGTPVDLSSLANYVIWIVVGIAGGGIALLLWNFTLRRNVAAQTQALSQALADLHQANRASDAAKLQLEATLEAIPDMLFEIDASGRYVAVHTGSDHLLAAPREHLIGKLVAEVLPANAAAVAMGTVQAAFRNGTDYGGLIQLEIDQRTYWFELSAARKGQADDPNATVLVLSRNVTPRQEFEQRIRESEARLRNVLDLVSNVAVYGHNDRDEILFWNRASELMFGYPAAEAMGRKVSDLIVPPEERGMFEEQLAHWLEQGVTTEAAETTRIDSNGLNLFVYSNRVMIDNAVGEREIYSFEIDLTEIKEATAELEEYKLQLEQLVMARTVELEVAKDAAEAGSRAKSTFLANISHEIRTPLSAMIGMISLLRLNEFSPAQAKQLDKLEGAALHLLDILNAVLDLSKIEAGKVVLESGMVDLDQIAIDVIEILGERAANKGLQLRHQVAAVPSHLMGDATRIRQAILNLVDNAIKFTHEGQICLRISTVEENADTALIRFEVEDTGIGIPPDKLKHLFTEFEQVDSSPKRQVTGTGLGLAITRQIAEMMGGTAGVQSLLGHGSTFWLTARLAKANASAPPLLAVETEPAEATLRRDFAGRHVLVAEDSDVISEVVRFYLEDVDLQVDVVENGQKAMTAAMTGQYQLILMDVRMPVMDGIEATIGIRKSLPATMLPIIAMTANAFSEDRELCLSAGMNDFLAKPVDVAELYRVLLKWLQAPADSATISNAADTE